MDITDCMYFALVFRKRMLNVFLLYPPNNFSYVDSFVNQEFFLLINYNHARCASGIFV